MGLFEEDLLKIKSLQESSCLTNYYRKTIKDMEKELSLGGMELAALENEMKLNGSSIEIEKVRQFFNEIDEEKRWKILHNNILKTSRQMTSQVTKINQVLWFHQEVVRLLQGYPRGTFLFKRLTKRLWRITHKEKEKWERKKLYLEND